MKTLNFEFNGADFITLASAEKFTTITGGRHTMFSDGVNGKPLSALTVDILPIQAGSGDPSLTNIRPITGLTGVNVKRAGKNIFDEATVLGSQSFTQQQDGSWYCAGNKYSSINQQHIYDNIGYDGQLSVTFRYRNSTSTIGAYPSIAYVGGTNESIPHAATTTVKTSTVTTDSSKAVSYIRWLYYSSSSSLYCNIQIELGDEATEYEPYTGNTYAVDWQSQAGTVYGGKFNVLTGELTVTAVAYNASDFPSYAKGASTTFDEFYFRTTGLIAPKNATASTSENIICSHAVSGQSSEATTAQTRIASSQPRILFPVGTMSTTADFDTWLSQQANNGTPLQFWYTIEPQIYQFTPQEITVLRGVNNIWIDGGEIETLTYQSVPTDGAGYVLEKTGFMVADRDHDKVIVPGMDGELTLDNGRWENTDGAYKCAVAKDYGAKKLTLQRWLAALGGGYGKLSDTEELTTFRMARFKSIKEKRVWADVAAVLEITFDCMPQRFLNSGAQEASVASGSVLTNPTDQVAFPLIVITGSGDGTLTVNGQDYAIRSIATSVTLDCKTRRAYSGTTPKDNTVAGYPVLIPGENTISFSGGITAVSIKPRWWQL